MKERIGYYDIARGLGIIFVVIGHIETFYMPFRSVIITFHMALFLILSGMLIYETGEEKRSFREMLKKKFYRIMVPYILFSVLSILIEFIRLSLQGIYYWPHFKTLLLITGSLYGNSVMWFLPALFMSEMIFLAIRKLKHEFMTIVSVVGLAVLAVWANTLPPVEGEFLQNFLGAIIRGVYCTLLIGIGYYVRKYSLLLKSKRYVCGALGVLLLYICTRMNHINPQVDLRTMHWGEIVFSTTSKAMLVICPAILYLVGAVSGALGIICLCRWAERFRACFVCKVLIFFGSNSLIIMATHLDWHVLHYSMDLATLLNQRFPHPLLYHTYVLLFVFAAEAVLIILINKYLPILAGKLKKESIS